MDRITQGYLDAFANSFQIANCKDTSKLFEKFATYCVVSHEFNDLFDLEEPIVGDGGDCGIDSIAIIVNGNIINTIEEFDDILDEWRSISEIKFIMVQAKTSTNFDGSEIATFGFGVKDLFSTQPKLVQNSKVKQKAKIISHIYDNAVKMKQKPECIMYYVTTGKWQDDVNITARIESIKNDLNDENIFSLIDFFPIDADKLQKYYKETIDSIEREIELPRRIPLPEMDDIQEAYLAIIPAKQYLSLITSDGSLLKSVLYDNVRDYQGDQNLVNNEIIQTLEGEDANKFVVLNNGITIICKSLRNVVRDKFLLCGYQIVNGCQTSHVLFKKRDIIGDNIFVTVKVISTTNGETVNQIIKATNRQTEVSNEQMMALGDFQKKLEAFYNTFGGSHRLYYERRSRQYADSGDIEKVRVITIQYQIKAFASMFLDKPHLASRYYGTLLKEATGIFDESHQLLPYYTSAYLLYKIDYLIRNKQIPQSINKFRFHVLMVLKYIFLNPKPQPQLNSRDIERLCETILEIANDHDTLMGYIERTRGIIESAVGDMEDPDNAKSSSKVELMKQRINPLYH